MSVDTVTILRISKMDQRIDLQLLGFDAVKRRGLTLATEAR